MKAWRLRLTKCIVSVGIVIFVVFMVLFVVSALGIDNGTIWGTILSRFPNNRIFADSEEWSYFEPYIIHEDTLLKDDYVEELQYTESFCHELAHENKRIRVYAYIFDTTESAQQYFLKATNKQHTFGLPYAHFSHADLFSACYIAFYDQCAYRIEGSNLWGFTESVNWFSHSFSREIPQWFDAIKENPKAYEEYFAT